MGFLTRLLVPRPVRRAMHPVSTAKWALTPRPVRVVRHAMHPVDAALYQLERSARARRLVYRHGACPVKHRSYGAAARCRHA